MQMELVSIEPEFILMKKVQQVSYRGGPFHVCHISRDGCIAEGCFFARHDNIIIKYQNFKGFKTKKTLKSVSF